MNGLPESALPCSRSALDNLGRRLAEFGEPSDDDRTLLMEVLEAYDDVLAEAEERVRAIVQGFTSSGGPTLGITTRVKTTGTIREKLRRQVGMGLKGMQDVAGIRLAGGLRRRQQNEIGAALMTEFSDSQRKPKLSDRRISPSSGYRALHVIVFVRDLPVEIQIRTSEQDAWAQLIEKLGDSWGRGIRYGEPPPQPARTVVGDMDREGVIALLMRISSSLESESVDELEDEELSDQLANLEGLLHTNGDELGAEIDREDMLDSIDTIKQDIHERQSARATRQKELRELLALLATAAESRD